MPNSYWLILIPKGAVMLYKTHRVSLLPALLLALASIPAAGQELPAPVCKIVIHDELVELEDARHVVDLARSRFATYEKIFAMIEGLWKGKTIPRMDYLEAKYDRDSAKLELEEADLILQRQAALVEQYRLICDETASASTQEHARALREAYLRYRRADCGSLAKAIEVAAVKLEFNREYLKRTLELRREEFATNAQVILAELDVELEEKNLADAKRRTGICRAELAEIDNGTGTSSPGNEP
jgi:hypothetical protein